MHRDARDAIFPEQEGGAFLAGKEPPAHGNRHPQRKSVGKPLAAPKRRKEHQERRRHGARVLGVAPLVRFGARELVGHLQGSVLRGDVHHPVGGQGEAHHANPQVHPRNERLGALPNVGQAPLRLHHQHDPQSHGVAGPQHGEDPRGAATPQQEPKRAQS